MSFDLFTLDVATACPAEYELMQKAGDEWRSLWFRLLDGDPGVTEAEVIAAKVREGQAEAAARAAHKKWLANQAK